MREAGGKARVDVHASVTQQEIRTFRFQDADIRGTITGDKLYAVVPADTVDASLWRPRMRIASNRKGLNLQLDLDSTRHINGKATAEHVLLGHILNDANLGQLTADAHINGTLDNFSANSRVQIFEYKNVTYRDAELSGQYHHGDIAARFHIDNPHVQTDIEGEWKHAKRSHIRLTGNVGHINPQALNLTNQWGNTRFSGTIDADFTASNMNDAEGSINLRNFNMVTLDSIRDTYHLHELAITSGYEADIHYLNVRGDMGEAYIQGELDWNTLAQSFVNYTASKLPTLPGLAYPRRRTPQPTTSMYHSG